MNKLSQTTSLNKVFVTLIIATIFVVVLFIRIGRQEALTVPIIGDSAPSYSLDAEVVGSADIGEVYLLEYRGSPNYRIMSYDSNSGELSEVFNIPSGGLVYSMTLNPSKDTLAIGYTADFTVDGNGIYLLNLLDLEGENNELIELVADQENTYYFDLEWAQEDTLWATETDSSANSNNVSSIDIESGVTTEVIADAIDPSVVGSTVAYFPLEADDSRRSVAVYDTELGTLETIDVFNKEYDLDNLVYDQTLSQLLVSTLNRSGGLTLRFGDSVYAHGNHSIPSSWTMLNGDGQGSIQAVDSQLESKLVYDAAATTNSDLLEVTNEGLYLSSTSGERELLVKSRALRFIAF